MTGRTVVVLTCQTEDQAEYYEHSAREFMPESVRVGRIDAADLRVDA